MSVKLSFCSIKSQLAAVDFKFLIECSERLFQSNMEVMFTSQAAGLCHVINPNEKNIEKHPVLVS